MMLGKIRNHKLLLFILIFAGFLRLWGLGTNPPHLTNDEAALGYNAYSILKTARDEHGELLPIIFKSFGDWKPGLYIYATVPFVAMFGLTEFSVRLASALSGVLAILLVYLIGKVLFKSERVGVLVSLFLAISPWHLQFSRGAWEANFSLTLVLCGIYFFLQAVKNQGKYLPISVLFFALTFWAYQGAKLSTTTAALILFAIYHKEVLSLPKKKIVVSVLLGVVIVLPILASLLLGKAGRLEIYSVFSYPRPEQYVQDILSQEGVTRDSLQYYLYHPEPFNFLRGILGRWMNHYSGRFLFFEGDWGSPRHRVPQAGVLLFVDVIFIILGLVALARIKEKRIALFVCLWLLFAPLPAALSRDSVHAVRSLNMVVPLILVMGLGANFLIETAGRKQFQKLLAWTVVAGIYIFSFAYYLDQYWIHAPKKYSEHWHYGYKQIVEKVTLLQGSYENIVIQQGYAQPYIFFLFYQKYDPSKYQAIARDVYIPSQYGDVGLISHLDNVEFREISWREDRGKSGLLFVADPIKVPPQDSSDEKEFNILDEIKFLNNQTAFRLIEVK